MIYLLDVNALIALGHRSHHFHARVEDWAAKLAIDQTPQFATSSITELGFVRVMSQAYFVSVSQARDLLILLKNSADYEFSFIVDDQDVSKLPSWVTLVKHTTDGHLAELAVGSGGILATLDEKIQGAFVIP